MIYPCTRYLWSCFTFMEPYLFADFVREIAAVLLRSILRNFEAALGYGGNGYTIVVVVSSATYISFHATWQGDPTTWLSWRASLPSGGATWLSWCAQASTRVSMPTQCSFCSTCKKKLYFIGNPRKKSIHLGDLQI